MNFKMRYRGVRGVPPPRRGGSGRHGPAPTNLTQLRQRVAKFRISAGSGTLAVAKARGTTAQGEYRSHARMAMIEPNSWDLNKVKVHPSPTIITFSMPRGIP